MPFMCRRLPATLLAVYTCKAVIMRNMLSKIDSSATLNDGEQTLQEALWRRPCRADRATILSELSSLEARTVSSCCTLKIYCRELLYLQEKFLACRV